MRPAVVARQDEIAAFCQKNGIRRLALFGSALRRDFAPNSDVDLLVEFEPGRVPGFLRLFDLEQELSPLFENHRIDMRTPQDLHRDFRCQVLSESEVLFAHS